MVSPLPVYMSDSIVQRERQKDDNFMIVIVTVIVLVVFAFPCVDPPNVFE